MSLLPGIWLKTKEKKRSLPEIDIILFVSLGVINLKQTKTKKTEGICPWLFFCKIIPK